MTRQLSDYRILVVDDHPFQRVHLADVLGSTGFGKADVASCAESALARINRQAYHLVLVDLNLAAMDGVQFIDQLARQPHPPMLAIVSSCLRRLIDSVALMAKEKGLVVAGAFSKPFTALHARRLATCLCQDRLPLPATRHRTAAPTFDRDSVEDALRERHLRAWFQPKHSVITGQIVSAEALARWLHPELGCLSPAAFLAAVRGHGLDKALLLRVLDDALDAHLHWGRQGFRVPVSVNLPTRFLDDPHLPDELEQLVLTTGVPAQEVSFELLEDETTTILGQYYMGASPLRLKGFGLAQDDFGRGYSSMYSLISTPFTELKIDRAFVSGAAHDESRAAALMSSVQLGSQLGLQVTAEGVETPADLELLRRIGCHCAQGFLFSAPVDTGSFSQLLAQERLTMNPRLP